MLVDASWRFRLTELDEQVFDCLVSKDHPLRALLTAIDWESFREVLNPHYVADVGQPACDPVFVLKIEFVRHFFGWSDRHVIERAKTDVAIRFFLGLGLQGRLPSSTTLCRFRARLGPEGFRQIFDTLVAQARKLGLVRDQLRLKDASHIIAKIAVPNTLELVAQIRDRLLKAAESFVPEEVQGYRMRVEAIREQTNGKPLEEQLVPRVELLEDILECVEQIPAPENPDEHSAWKQLATAIQLASKILSDREPGAKWRTVSVVDPDARRGKHGEWYDGYSLDVLMDADSELITQLNLLPASGDEARDTIELIRREEAAHNNDVQAVSTDGIGFHGPMLRELEDPTGLAVAAFVPPKEIKPGEGFAAEDFQPTPDGEHVVCPAGQTSRYAENDRPNSTVHRFAISQCQSCPLVQACIGRLPRGPFGRHVRKHKYDQEFQRARQRARTEEYAEVRRRHHAIERKLNELLNHLGGRRARYWGLAKVFIQQLMTGFTANLKRIEALLRARSLAVTG